MICAALWAGPADPDCPQAFRDAAARILGEFAAKVTSGPKLLQSCSQASFSAWTAISNASAGLEPGNPVHWGVIRGSLLGFIADVANWDKSTKIAFLTAHSPKSQAKEHRQRPHHLSLRSFHRKLTPEPGPSVCS